MISASRVAQASATMLFPPSAAQKTQTNLDTLIYPPSLFTSRLHIRLATHRPVVVLPAPSRQFGHPKHSANIRLSLNALDLNRGLLRERPGSLGRNSRFSFFYVSEWGYCPRASILATIVSCQASDSSSSPLVSLFNEAVIHQSRGVPP
ncbi:hypothetical protein AAF712_012999, partial [Marasmius tenuissimus]